MTVWPASIWIGFLTPDIGAQAVGYSIKAPGGGMNIINGCEGLDVLFLLRRAEGLVELGLGRFGATADRAGPPM
jgi:hypothetical protein